MGDRIAVMKLGVLQQIGSPEELYTRPKNVFVARFIGSPSMNLVPAGLIEGAGSTGMLAGFRPEHVEPANGKVDGAHFEALVEVVEYLGDEQLVHLRLKDTPLLAKLDIEQRLATGERQTFRIPRTSCTCSTQRPSRLWPARASAAARASPAARRPRCRRLHVARPDPRTRRPRR